MGHRHNSKDNIPKDERSKLNQPHKKQALDRTTSPGASAAAASPPAASDSSAPPFTTNEEVDSFVTGQTSV